MCEWYEELNDKSKIYQGEIFDNFPVYWPIRTEDGNITLESSEVECIVITQACDLENNKVDQVTLLEIIDIKDFIKALELSGKGKKEIRNMIKAINKGQQARYQLLNSKDYGSLQFDYKIVDFSKIISQSYKEILKVKENIRTTVKLQTPYREYVSQRFGVFYSRIGLPLGISDNRIEKDLKEIYGLK